MPRWDPWVRLFHWSLALSVGFLLLSGATGIGFFDWHRVIGELALSLVVFRLAWGAIGPANARLLSLMRGPRAVAAHVRHLAARDVPPEPGHNAAGGWAVLLMLALVGFQGLSGTLIADEDEFVEGRFYGALGSDAGDTLYRLHHLNAELLQIIVLVHVAMIAVYAVWGRRNLLLPMLHLRGSMANRRRLWLGAALATATGIGWWLIFGSA